MNPTWVRLRPIQAGLSPLFQINVLILSNQGSKYGQTLAGWMAESVMSVNNSQ